MSDTKKPKLSEIVQFIWDTKIYIYYLKVALLGIPLAVLFIFGYWLVTGEIP